MLEIKIHTEIKGLKLLSPLVFEDNCGEFFDCYNVCLYDQEKEYHLNYGMLRGIHYQEGLISQGNVFSVICGAAYVVAVDVRKNYDTYGKWFGVYLSQENKHQFYMEKGIAYAFVALRDNTIIRRKSNVQNSKSVKYGIAYNDPILKINWDLYIDTNRIQVSEKDYNFNLFSEI